MFLPDLYAWVVYFAPTRMKEDQIRLFLPVASRSVPKGCAHTFIITYPSTNVGTGTLIYLIEKSNQFCLICLKKLLSPFSSSLIGDCRIPFPQSQPSNLDTTKIVEQKVQEIKIDGWMDRYTNNLNN